jgi:hypothetical protein
VNYAGTALLRTFWRGAVAIVAVASLASCSRVEQGVLDRFFEASRLRDRTVLRSMATVAFEPHEQGIIRTFTIVSVGEAERRPLNVRGADAQIVSLSIPNPPGASALSGTAVDIVTEEVRMSAPVVLPNGETKEKTLSLILQRAIVRSTPATTGRWIVTGIVVRDST